MKKVRFLFGAYLFVILLFFLYSYTQVDLSLTLSRLSIYQTVEKFFQHIGYFQRPFSTLLYLIIISLLYIFYILFLVFANKKKVTKQGVWILVSITAVILTFSYNAFSYDLFNYIFDAKIFTYYHQNPYFHKALDYPGDPMLSFMHWTHRVYPYGPTWLFLTIPLSFVGLNIFLPTFFLFKALASASFLGTVFFIGKVVKKISPNNEIVSMVFFGLNPLVITESLISSHNDISMIFLSLWALYLIMKNKYVRSFTILILSIGIKFATLFLIPVFAALYLLKKYKKTINWNMVLLLTAGLMTISVIVASLRTNFQPWYLLYVLPFAALIPCRYYIFLPAITISLFANLQYIPFLYLGNWNSPVPGILSGLLILSISLSLLATAIWFLFNKYISKSRVV